MLKKYQYLLVFLATLILGALPFLVYLYQRHNGILPSSEEWYATGTNHGPWRSQIESLLLYKPLILLGIWNAVLPVSGVKAWTIKLLIFALQATLLVLQFFFLVWTTD